MIHFRTIAPALAGLGLLAAASMPAMADGTKVGTLSCRVSGGIGFIITSSKALNCVFEATNGAKERYVGTIRRFGIDIGVTGEGRLGWIVIAPEKGRKAGAREGDYAGVGAEVTVVGGVGANALLGGFERSITLQPLSLQVQTGGDLAVGVTSLNLEPVRLVLHLPCPKAATGLHRLAALSLGSFLCSRFSFMVLVSPATATR